MLLIALVGVPHGFARASAINQGTRRSADDEDTELVAEVRLTLAKATGVKKP